jgi:hypothetical protein
MRRVVLFLTAFALALVGPISSASAERGVQDAPDGNAPARIDITRFTVDNGQRWFTMKVDVRNLREKGKFEFSYWRGVDGPTPSMRSLIIAVHRVDGETRARFFSCGFEDCIVGSCPRLRASWRSDVDVVRVSAPQRCFPVADPDTPPPAGGRFFTNSQMGDESDTDVEQLALVRG